MAAGNLAASVHQKLLDKANAEQRPFSELQARRCLIRKTNGLLGWLNIHN